VTRERVLGSPYQPGDAVRVVRSVEPAGFGTDVLAWVGLQGEVVHLDYLCGCGQRYPDDPMIGVLFKNGDVQEFWHDELEALSS
jgi:hypothetical protein